MSEEKKVLCYVIGSDKIYFSDHITDESIACLMDCFDVVVNDENFNNKIDVYWQSYGGLLGGTLNLATYIYTLPRDIEINFIVNNDLASGGAFAIYELAERCNFLIADTIYLMFHTPNRDSRDRLEHVNKIMDKSNQVYTDKYVEIFKLSGFPDDLIEKFRDGHDIYISGEDFKVYLNKYLEWLDFEYKMQELEQLETYTAQLRVELGECDEEYKTDADYVDRDGVEYENEGEEA